MEELRKFFIEIGYTEEEYEIIVNTYPLSNLKVETLLNKVKENYNFLIELGYSREDVIKMTKSLPAIYSLSIENIKQKIENLIELGYSREDVIKMTKKIPQIYGLSIESIRQKIEDLKELGYSGKDVIKMTKTIPTIYGLSIENIKQKIEDLKELGYSREDVIKMTKTLPTIYNYSIENIKQKIEDLKELGYSGEDAIKMTKSLPSLYSLSIENIKQKIEFYNSINLHFLAVEDTKRLMQSTALSYARYMFYKERGITIDESNYKKLFIGQKQFERQYGINNKDLIARYDYKKVLEDKEKRRQGLKSTQELGIETVEEQKDPELLDRIESIQRNQLRALNSKREKLQHGDK